MKSTFSHTISELLFDYDCVIVPSLGGFVTNYRPARLDKELNVFFPPSKDLSFNKNLNKNDGILANAVARAEQLSHEEANERIKSEVEQYFSSLNEHGRVVFEKVGILYFDKEKRIQFSPDESENYLLESFGLKKIHAVPTKAAPISVPQKKKKPAETPVIAVSKKEDAQPVEQAAAPLIHDVAEKEEETNLIPMPSRKWYWAAAIIPFLIYMGLVADHSNVLHDGDIQWGDLSLADSSVPSAYQVREQAFRLEHEEVPLLAEDRMEQLLRSDHEVELSQEPKESAEPVAELAASSDYGPTEDTRKHSEEEKDESLMTAPAAAMSTYVAPSEISHMEFHVIAGCFSVEANAKKLVDRLRRKGYEAYIIDKRNGLHRVTFGSFALRKEAEVFLGNIKQEEDTSAWLLRKK